MNDSPQLLSVFSEALERQSGAERAAYLDRACGDDADLRARVEDLLRAHERAPNFLEGSPPQRHPGATVDEIPVTERPGTLIGPYKLLQQIGEGGMGTVFMAEQTQPVQRKVALKLIKAGMDSAQVIARFEAERQALAMMDHVNIARVFDAGATEAGRPYFVMELVHGVPITKYCDDNRLTPRERLELFVPVCQAIQHAHQKGIIHRDLKPSNVMITLYDGKPVPKVIDFGVAKATEQKLTERTLFTQYGTMVGTFEYMSPEQAEMSALGVDTRSDIYSLGVLMYELLTGSTPLSRKRVKEAAYGEVLRMIKEEEPPRPSTRLSDSGEALASISAQRHMEPAKLTKLVRGELDWIAMKALEKDRNRRYETATGLAADVQRYLNDEPVLACPPSFWYRFRKLARRNKRAFVTASAVVLLLLAGTGISSYFAVQALDRAKEAEHNARLAKTNEEAADQQRQEAQENLKDARAAVDQMLTRVAGRLEAVPQMEHVRRELLEDALKFYQKFLERKGDDPVIRRETAWAYRRLAAIQRSLGQLVEAEKSFRKALAMFEELEAQSPLEPSTRVALVQAHCQFGRFLSGLGNREEPAEEHLRRAVQMAEDLVKEFPKDPGHGELFVSANVNLITLTRLPPDQAEEMLRRNLKLTKNTYLVGYIYWHLGVLGVRQGRYPEAKKDYLKALERCETVASANPSSSSAQRDLAMIRVDLADAMAADGQREEAEPLYRRAIAIMDKLATDYPGIHSYRTEQAGTHYKYATVLNTLDRRADAEKAYRRAVELYERLGADFATIPAYQQIAFDQRLGLGRFLVEAGRPQDALQVYGQAIALSGKVTADFPTRLKHWQGLVRSHIELGRLLERTGKTPAAEEAFRQALAISERLEAEHGGKPDYRRDVARCHLDAAWLLRLESRCSEAEKLYRWALQHYVKLANESPQARQAREDSAYAHFMLADLLRWVPGRLADAEKGFRQALEQYEKLSADFPNEPGYRITVADCRERLASVFLFQGRLPEAEQGFKEALALAERLAEEHPADRTVRITLAMGSKHWGETMRDKAPPREVEKAFRRAEALLEKLVADFPHESWCRRDWGVTCQMLVALLARDLKQPRAAEEFYRRAVATFEKLAAEFPRDPSYRVQLADAHREWAFCLRDSGRSQEATAIFDLAIANFAKAIELGSRDVWGVWYPLALLHLSTGRTKEYRMLCETLLKRFGQVNDPDFWVVIICKLAPDAVADLTRPVQIAEKMLARNPHNAELVGVLGDTLYRKGDLKAAVQRLEASIRAAPGIGVHWRRLFLAMAYHRLGRAAEARQLLQEAVRWIEKNGQEKLAKGAELKEPLPWSVRLDLQLLRRETEELLGKKSGP
jgi:eukaryotic-like serine/threonine-protein kinase